MVRSRTGPLLSKRFAVVVVFFIATYLILFRNHDTTAADKPWSVTLSNDECPLSRRFSYHVQPPKEGDREARKDLWKGIQRVFETNRPVPDNIKASGMKGFPEKDKLDTFFHLSAEAAKRTRSRHQNVLNELPTWPKGIFNGGRGVVMVAGKRYTEFASTTLGMLREMQSRLPVEIWAENEAEEVPGWCDELADEGVSCRRLSNYMDVSLLTHRYAYKAFSMFFSSFEEILFLDADSAPIVNPDRLFESRAYKDTGAVLWPDYWRHSGSPWLPYLIGTSETKSSMLADEQSVESGQILWDKKRHWKGLMLAMFYNYYGSPFWYTIFNNGWLGWGDKDTFPMALKATNEPYVQVKQNIKTGVVSGTEKGVAMMQADPDNQDKHIPMFLHSNLVKWSMRNLACTNCPEIPGHKQRYHQLNNKSEVHEHLKEGIRIFRMKEMDELKIDPEPILWKQIEWTACRSKTWAVESACNWTRQHMQKALGYEFRLPRLVYNSDLVTNQTCIIEPAVFKRPI